MMTLEGMRCVYVTTLICVLACTAGCPPNSSTLDPNSPPASGSRSDEGACCKSDDSCATMSLDDCITGGGVFQGKDTDCELCDGVEVRSGACCLADAGCLTLTPENCAISDGQYEGDDTSCDDVDCQAEPVVEAAGACCTDDGCIDDLTQDDCELDGIYQGDGSDCADATIDCSPDSVEDGQVDNDLEALNASVQFDGLPSGNPVTLIAPDFETLTRINEGCSCSWSTNGDGTFNPQSGEAACTTSYTPAANDTVLTVIVTCFGDSRVAEQSITVEAVIAAVNPPSPGGGGGGGGDDGGGGGGDPPDPCEGVNCDDSNPCTVDTCNNGACVNTPVPNAVLCDDGNECTAIDRCAGAVCMGDASALNGDRCAGSGNFCDGPGVCNNGACELAGDPCIVLDASLTCDEENDVCFIDNGCLGPATCTLNFGDCGGNRVCIDGVCNYDPANFGNPCGDAAQTDCDSRDRCDGFGTCLLNNEPDGTICTEDGNECTDDVCAAGICDHPGSTAGTACGDSSATDCDGADSCDGAGNCDDSFAINGFACDDGDLCTDLDECDGAGVCAGTALSVCPVGILPGVDQIQGGEGNRFRPSSTVTISGVQLDDLSPGAVDNIEFCWDVLLATGCEASAPYNTDIVQAIEADIVTALGSGGLCSNGQPNAMVVGGGIVDLPALPFSAPQPLAVSAAPDANDDYFEMLRLQLSAWDTGDDPTGNFPNTAIFQVGVRRSEFHIRLVADGGDNANTGGDLDCNNNIASFATIQAATDLAKAGDTVLIHGGDYNLPLEDAYIHFANSGEPGLPITVEGVPGETITITTGGANPPVFNFTQLRGGANQEGYGHYVFRNLKMHTSRHAWWFEFPQQGTDLATEQARAIHDVLIEDCEIWNCQSALKARNAGVRNLTVRRTHSHHNTVTEGGWDFGEWKDFFPFNSSNQNPLHSTPASASHDLVFEDCDSYGNGMPPNGKGPARGGSLGQTVYSDDVAPPFVPGALRPVGTLNTITLAIDAPDAVEWPVDPPFLDNAGIEIIDGAGSRFGPGGLTKNQAGDIESYDRDTKILTIKLREPRGGRVEDPWTVAPDNTSVYDIRFNVQANGWIFQDCVYNVTFRRCRAYNNAKYGFGCKGTSAVPGVTNIHLDRCAAWGNDSTQSYNRGMVQKFPADPGNPTATPDLRLVSRVNDVLLTNCVFIAPADQRGGAALNWRDNANIRAYNSTIIGLRDESFGVSGGYAVLTQSTQQFPTTLTLHNSVVYASPDAPAIRFTTGRTGPYANITYVGAANQLFSTSTARAFTYQTLGMLLLSDWQDLWAGLVVGGGFSLEPDGDGAANGPPANNSDADSLFGDPLFVDLDPLNAPHGKAWPANFTDAVDLRLQATSPAIDLGDDLSGLGIPELLFDYDGNPRPNDGSPWNPGAYNVPVP